MIIAVALTTAEVLSFSDSEISIVSSQCDGTSCSVVYEIGGEQETQTFSMKAETELEIEYKNEVIARRTLYFDQQFVPKLAEAKNSESLNTDLAFELEHYDGLHYSSSTTPICVEHFAGHCEQLNQAASQTSNPIIMSKAIQVTCLGCRVFDIDMADIRLNIKETLNIVQRYFVVILFIAILEVCTFSGLVYIRKRPKAKK